ncbi:MAG: hypothetical protein ACXAC7_08375 [Candidatus Hodarchaeales archaeon]|jgi:hypothetical protein
MLEVFYIIYGFGLLIACSLLFFSTRAKSTLNFLENKIPDNAKEELEVFLEKKKKNPYAAPELGLNNTLFFKWWNSKNTLMPSTTRENTKLDIVTSKWLIYSVFLSVAPYLLGLTVLFLVASMMVAPSRYGIQFDYISILIALGFISYIEHTKINLALGFIPYMAKHQEELSLIDWGLIEQLKTFLEFRIRQLIFWSILFGFLMFVQKILLELIVLVIFVPIGSFLLAYFMGMTQSIHPFIITFLVILAMLTVAFYMYTLEKILTKGYKKIVQSLMLYLPILGLLPPRNIESTDNYVAKDPWFHN